MTWVSAMADFELELLGKNLDEASGRLIRRVALSIHEQLIRANPVDTGWSRANWLISVGTPPPTGAANKGSPGATGQAAGLARLLTYQVNQGAIWIANSVPYIPKLDEGHSKQAPAGWIGRAVDAGVRSVIRQALGK